MKYLILAVALPCVGARLRQPVRTTVSDRGGVVHINLVPVAGGDSGVLHLRMTGRRISREAAQRSIAATSVGIHSCPTCTVVVEMGECRGVSPLALPVTARFLLSHPTLKHICIIEARGAVLLACRTVRRLSGNAGSFDLYRSWADFEAACSRSAQRGWRQSALDVGRRLRPWRGRAAFDVGARLRALVGSRGPPAWTLPTPPGWLRPGAGAHGRASA